MLQCLWFGLAWFFVFSSNEETFTCREKAHALETKAWPQQFPLLPWLLGFKDLLPVQDSAVRVSRGWGKVKGCRKLLCGVGDVLVKIW